MKTFTFHLDMIIAVIVLFALSVGANIFQWQTHGTLNKQYISNKLELTERHVSLIYTEMELKECLGTGAEQNTFRAPAS